MRMQILMENCNGGKSVTICDSYCDGWQQFLIGCKLLEIRMQILTGREEIVTRALVTIEKADLIVMGPITIR